MKGKEIFFLISLPLVIVLLVVLYATQKPNQPDKRVLAKPHAPIDSVRLDVGGLPIMHIYPNGNITGANGEILTDCEDLRQRLVHWANEVRENWGK